MTPAQEIIEWLRTFDPAEGTGIDEGGLAITNEAQDKSFEIGGIPTVADKIEQVICEWSENKYPEMDIHDRMSLAEKIVKEMEL